MSSELITRGPSTGAVLYSTIRGSGQSIWSTSGGTGGFEAFNAANYTDYDISLTEQGSTNIFIGNAPLALPAGVFNVFASQRVGGSPAVSDPIIAFGTLEWNGTETVPLSDLATSGQLGQLQPMRIARGCMVPNFPFLLVSATDHVTPVVSGALTLSGQISRDGTAFTALQSGAFLEIGLGFYQTTLTSGDLLCNTAALWFQSDQSDPRTFSLVTQRVSGSL